MLKGSGRVGNGPFAGVTWQATSALTLAGAAHYDHISNAPIGNAQQGSGNRYTLVALAEYALSRHIEMYDTVDFDRVSGAASVELPGKNNQTGVAIGQRTIFQARQSPRGLSMRTRHLIFTPGAGHRIARA